MDDDVLLEQVYARAAARRQRGARTRAMVGGAVLVAVAVTAALLVRASRPDATVVADDNSPAPRTVAFNGIVFDLPDDWSEVKPGCGMQADKTVSVGTYGGSCGGYSAAQPPTTAVQIYEVYGPQLFNGGGGTPFAWRGKDQGLLSEEQRGDLHVVTLAVPRLNAAISAQSPDAETARRLAVDDAHARAVPAPGVLGDADKVFIQSFAGTDGDGLERSATVTTREDVDAVAADLRALPTLDRMTPLCGEPANEQSATITVTKGDVDQTFAARFDDCAQTTSGDGNVMRTSSELRADVIRLVPNSGLDASGPRIPAAPSCNPPLPGNGIRPPGIFFGCATSADNLDNIQWTSWTATSATGTATRNIDECRRPNPPPCTDGSQYTHFPVKVTLTNPDTVDVRYVFRTITLSPATTNEAVEATQLFCGAAHACTVPPHSWGYAPQ